MSKIVNVLELLRDGRWHEIVKMQFSLGLNEHRFQEIITFLNSYGLIEIDGNKEKAKINRDFRELLTQPIK